MAGYRGGVAGDGLAQLHGASLRVESGVALLQPDEIFASRRQVNLVRDIGRLASDQVFLNLAGPRQALPGLVAAAEGGEDPAEIGAGLSHAGAPPLVWVLAD